MIKFRMYYDKDKETQWLNEMANEGWAMKSFFCGVFTFEPCEKGEYQYQIDFCDGALHISDSYREFMKENDIEIVQQWGFWVILRKKASEGDFVLYTDVDSQIEQYKKILMMFRIVTVVEFLALLYEVYAAVTLHGPVIWGIVCLIMALVIVFINNIVRTQNTISELEERKTGIKAETKNNISVFLMIGFLFNSVSLVMADSVSPYLKTPVQIVAIIFMLYGVYDTLTNVRKQRTE